MLYGGGQFTDLAHHPQLVVTRGYSSAAAGAYQFLPATWSEAARRLRLPDFQPASQDQAALYLMEKRGALSRFDRQGLSHDVLAMLAPEWASLPTLQGGSYYGQPVKGVDELRRFYSEDLARQRGERSDRRRTDSGFAVNHPAPLIVSHFEQVLRQQPLDLGPHHGTACAGGKLQFDQGIIQAETSVTAGSGQPQQLPLQGWKGRSICRGEAGLHQGAVGFLHHGGNQEQVHHLADAHQTQAHQPDATTHGLAAIEAMDAVEAEQTHGPEQIGEPQAAPLLPQQTQGL